MQQCRHSHAQATVINSNLGDRLAVLPPDEDPDKTVFDREDIDTAAYVIRSLAEALSGALHAVAALPPTEWTDSQRSGLLQVR